MEWVKLFRKSDPIMHQLIRRVGPLVLEPEHKMNPYQALFRSIVYQQLTGKAAETILKRVIALFPDERFPKPESVMRISNEALRGAGLSGAKTAAIKDLALKTMQKELPTARQLAKMQDQDIVEKLTVVRGIGPWTVEMLLIFKMGRMDVLPATDYGVRKGFALTYKKRELPHPKKLIEFGERWRPYRTVASWYLWRSLEL